jgi:hypothetical protein
LVVLVLIAGCQGDPAPGTSPSTPATPADYPDLASVPSRPNLSYTIEQRNEIARGLVADRANARHRQAELAYATGRSDTPPPPPPAPPAVAPAAAPAAPAAPVPGDAPIARGYVDANLTAATDDGELRDFMRRMERKIPDPYGPRTLTQAVGLAPLDPAAAQEGVLDGFGSFLGGVLGVESAGSDPPADPNPP